MAAAVAAAEVVVVMVVVVVEVDWLCGNHPTCSITPQHTSPAASFDPPPPREEWLPILIEPTRFEIEVSPLKHCRESFVVVFQ